MLRHLSVLLSIILFSSASSQAAVLIEDGGRSVNQSYIKTAGDGLALRKIRKVGVGVSSAGALGVMGVNLELNFSPTSSFVGGYGFGSGFQSFNLQIKHMLSGRHFLPYIAGGYARWYTNGEERERSITSSNPAFLSKKFLNEEERQSGQFAENFIYPSAGIQYMQLDGDWAGASLYLELVMLLDLDDFVSAPTGELGFTYYF